MSRHLIVEDGFGSWVHVHPHTREPWTPETARDWQRRCLGTGRSGGIAVHIAHCECEWTP